MTTLVTFLLDRSGSMQHNKASTIEAFNAYLSSLKEETDATIDFTFLQFDTGGIEKVCVATPITNVVPLTNATYQPRGGTPLIDAAYKTIKAVEEAVIRIGGAPKVVVCFQTDGQENESTEHTLEELSALISARTAEGWQFNFMGAGIDAYAQARAMGIAAMSTMSYNHTDKAATRASFTASAENTRAFASGRAQNTNYSVGQRTAAGDRFTPADLSGVPVALDLTQPAVARRNPAGRRVTVPDLKL
jgi:uncharacterized protein YegL